MKSFFLRQISASQRYVALNKEANYGKCMNLKAVRDKYIFIISKCVVHTQSGLLPEETKNQRKQKPLKVYWDFYFYFFDSADYHLVCFIMLLLI